MIQSAVDVLVNTTISVATTIEYSLALRDNASFKANNFFVFSFYLDANTNFFKAPSDVIVDQLLLISQ